MNKRTIQSCSILFLLVLFSLAGCERSDLDTAHQAGDPIVLQLAMHASTRINSSEAGDKFESGDQIRLLYDGVSHQMQLTVDQWLDVAQGGKSLFWKPGAAAAEFSAIHPYEADASDFSLPAYQGSLADLGKSDYMISPQISVTRGDAVGLSFKRKVARVKVNITFDAGIVGDAAKISQVYIYSPASGYEGGVAAGSAHRIEPYEFSEGRYCALVIPTQTQMPGQLFVEMTTVSGETFTYQTIPAMTAGKSYTCNLTVRNKSLSEMTAEQILIGEWDEKTFDDGDWKRSVTFADGSVEYFTPGERVALRAPFEAQKKFARWSADSQVEFENPLAGSTTFVMPDRAVTIAASYLSAPYKMTIQKPGIFIDSRTATTYDPALVEETEESFVRYFAKGDEVAIMAPSEMFAHWTQTPGSNANIIMILNLGGGQAASTWFRMRDFDGNLYPEYKSAGDLPYWSTEQTQKQWLEANFIERVNTNEGFITIPGNNIAFYRALTQEEKAVIMRAMEAVEQTFAEAPRRRISINFAVTNWPGSGVAAATTPVVAVNSPKKTWLSSDFDGRAAGLPASSSSIEAVWRDQYDLPLEGGDAHNRYIGFRDGTVVINVPHLDGWFKGADPKTIPAGHVDMQSVMMHEIAHLICYHSHNARPADPLMALDVFVAHISDPANISIVNRNMYTNEGGEAIVYSELVKQYYGGKYLTVMSQFDNQFDFGHLLTMPGEGVGSIYRAGGSTTRRFQDFELAFLQEMGWKIAPQAWQNPPLNN